MRRGAFRVLVAGGVSNANARKGAKFETDLLAYLRSGGLITERLVKTGREDECDLVVSGGPFARGRRFEIIEAKDHARLELAGWLKERDIGVANFAKHRGLHPLTLVGLWWSSVVIIGSAAPTY
jgi:hypothetical protein